MLNGPTFKEAFLFWLKLGFISFGGPAGQISIMYEYLVEKKKWISPGKFSHALNYCMLLPGPEAQQLATYTGWLLHGVRGGLAAGILFFLPSMLILLVLSIIYVTYGSLPWVKAIFDGLKPAIVAIVLLAMIKIGGRALKNYFHYIAAVLSFIAIYIFNVSFPLIILCVILLSVIFIRYIRQHENRNSEKHDFASEAKPSEFYISESSVLPHTVFSVRNNVLFLLSGIILWLAPFMFYRILQSDTIFWDTLSFFFTKAAFVTFGGAYAVLPYVAQYSVEKLQWLNSLQMLDGLALGETTPGPLIMVLAFVGFMAGYNHFGGSMIMGAAGLGLTTYFTFLPCFLFIFIGAPLIEKTAGQNRIKAVLDMVTASVVGVILSLAIYLGKAVIIDPSAEFGVKFFPLLWIAISVFALYKLKVNMILWILVSGIAGLLWWLIIHT
ncbi:MAG: chromate transporter [Bacteroidetes bacterium]|nr:MAG: chromate transporter [Bacteroidota bacterium]REK05051.1 MAG: chromate transporter [Bacteroidota bacterium]REK35559.1 MAG: chromate transporter [Bacteroidota bacterium]REK51662.1 MAG: chromate transporter [Bacteroidota bacterium]